MEIFEIPPLSLASPVAVLPLVLKGGIPSSPEKMKLDCIVFIREGEMSVEIDMRRYEVGPGCFVMLHPNNYFSVVACKGPVKGRVLFHRPELILDLLTSVAEHLPRLVKINPRDAQFQTAESASDLQAWFNILERMSRDTGSPNYIAKIEHLLHAFHLDMLDYVLKKVPVGESKRSRREEIMANFMVALGRHVRSHRSVNFYASELCVSPKHLSAIVKELTGVSASTVITRVVVKEAEMLLKTTRCTIQQISDMLAFPNQSFFGKYFKKQTGMSPNAYRQMHR